MSESEICNGCPDIKSARSNKFCGGHHSCPHYTPLSGEGKTIIVKKTKVREICSICSSPADYRITWLYEHYRMNPRSSAYGKDDCSRCSDKEAFACSEHRSTVEYHTPLGCDRGTTIFDLQRFPHMGLYWKEEELKNE